MREKMKGNYDIAIGLFEKCISLDENSHASHFALSDLYERQGNDYKAIEHAEKAYELDKENKWYTLRCADLYYKQGNYHKSAKFFELAIDENEKSLEIKFRYTEALIYSEQPEKAIKMLNEIEVETGVVPEISMTKHDLYLEMGEPEKANAELEKLIEANPGNFEYRIQVIDYFLITGQEDKAEELVNETLQLNPNLGMAHIAMADINLRRGKIEEAFKHMEIAFSKEDVSLDKKLDLIWDLVPYSYQNTDEAPIIDEGLAKLFKLIYDEDLKSDKLHSYYGVFLKYRGELSAAKDQFKIVCTLNPDSYNSWNQLLNLEYELGFYQEMFEDGKKALELFPAQPMIYLLTGIGAYEAGKYTEAEEYLFLGGDLVVQDPELSSEFRYHRGKVHCLQKNYSEGYKYFDEALAILPENVKIYGTYGLFYQEEGKNEQAKQMLDKGILVDPLNPALADSYGTFWFREGNFEKAIEYYKKAIVLEEYNFNYIAHLGDAQFKAGKKDEALANWKKSAEMGNPDALLKKKIADETYYEE